MRLRLTSLLLTAVVAAVPTATAWAQAKVPQTEDQKTLYALGAFIEKRMDLSIFGLSAEELEWVKAGLSDALLTDKVTDAFLTERGPKIEDMARTRLMARASKEKEAGAAYQAKAAAEPGAKKLPSGGIYRELKAGTGASPKPTDTVTANYHGTLLNGKIFDSTIERKQPAELTLTDMITCFSEGFQQLTVGGKAKLVCPSDQAYGDMGAPPMIGPGATLLFEIELISIAAPPVETPAVTPTPPPPAP